MQDLTEYIESHTLRIEVSRRGGGIEIDASEYLNLPNAKATAYQNYLGGGMLGAVQADRNFSQCAPKREAKYQELSEALKRYFHNLTNEEAGDYDDWSESDYDSNQERPVSAY